VPAIPSADSGTSASPRIGSDGAGSGSFAMSSITIRNLDPGVKARQRIRAAQRGRSMEAEARRILQAALEASGVPRA
jgi:hypothetical protein